MSESSPRIAALRRRVARLAHAAPPATSDRITLGTPIDPRIGGGLQRGRLHEIVAADAGDSAAAAGFAAMLACRIGGTDDTGPIVWLRIETRSGSDGGALYPPGLNEVGIDPARVLLIAAPDPAALLRAAGEAVRCPAVAVAVIELWREPRRVDLSVSRRLALAAEASGATPLLLRIAADPVPTAARTRWGVGAAPSTPLADGGAGAPGAPALDLELLRQRGGPAGWRWRVEWNRDRACFDAGSGAALPSDLAAVSGSGPAGDRRVRVA